MPSVIWEVRNNLVAGDAAQQHFRDRATAVNVAMGNLKAVFVANPGSYWRIEDWNAFGNARATVRVGPGAGSAILADYSLTERSLDDVTL